MPVRSTITLLVSWFAACLLPLYAQTSDNMTPLQYIPLQTPCRAVDTRITGGPIAAGTTRSLNPAGGACNIILPSTGPIVYALNVTVVPHGPLGYLSVWPAGGTQPLVSTLNSPDGRIKANAALATGGNGGEINVYATDTTDLVLDVSGYFTANTISYVYVPVTPCRVVDTRQNNGTPFGTPSLIAGQQRTFELVNGSCNLPSAAFTNGGAVSLNVTAVPIDDGPVGYVTVWGTSPTEPQTPLISTLNDVTGTITANASIVTINPSTSESVSVYSNNNTDLLLDITGYFEPSSLAPSGLSLYTLSPCRIFDTRESSGEFKGELTVPLTTGNNCNVPANAKAVVMNATVVPAGSLGYLALWPDGIPQPLVSTLNAVDGSVTSNMAIVSTTNGSIDAFAYDTAQLILDASAYFAPAPSFTLSTSPLNNSLMIEPGSTVPFTLTAFPVNGFTGNVQAALTASTGLTVTPSTVTLVPGVAQAIAVMASPNAVSTNGFNSTVSIEGTSGTISQTLTEAVEIEPNYAISFADLGPGLSSGSAYDSGTFSVTPAPIYEGTVTAQLTGLPPGLTVGTSGFGPPTPTGFGPANSVTLYSRCPGEWGPTAPCEFDRYWIVYDGAQPGIYPLTLTTTSGTIVHAESFNFTVGPVFSVAVSPTGLTIPQGGTQTVTLAPSGYGVGTSTIYSSLQNLPTGVSATQTASSNGTATITLTPGPSSTPGTYIVTGVLSQNIYVPGYTNPAASPSVTAPFSLTIAPAPSAQQLPTKR